MFSLKYHMRERQVKSVQFQY